jgi:4-alpha-glucanotransferase
MNDAAVYNLAARAGITIKWRDHTGRSRRASLDTIRHILTAIGLPCQTANDLAESRHRLDARAPPPVITATTGQPIHALCADAAPSRLSIRYEDGAVAEVEAQQATHGFMLPPIAKAGYHQIDIGSRQLTLAVAPARCVTIADVTRGERVWGLAAQIYALRSRDDCGIGDTAGVVALGRAAAALNAAALALSPTHALFAADPNHFSPYAPSNRIYYNPLHADAAAIFGDKRFAKAKSDAVPHNSSVRNETTLIDWPRATRLKMTVFRRLFEEFLIRDFSANPRTALGEDFAQFRASQGQALAAHSLFEALHAARLRADSRHWNWQTWSPEWRDPSSRAVRDFAEANEQEILFHSFLQWIAGRSLAAAQQKVTDAGMRIGLIADLAVGMSTGGSAAWGEQKDMLLGLQIGAPPDLFNAAGQNWGLTTFSPRALVANGFAGFIATLRACMRHSGGVRIDHAMNLMRLWLVPQGAEASEGAYLAYPFDDLLRLTALESLRHRAVLIGEDLGTVPAGFRERLSAAGIYGMNVLWFEREGASFRRPRTWPPDAAAMTSTHDLPTVAGWWRGRDIEVREQCGVIADYASNRDRREQDRQALWRAFRAAKIVAGAAPPPEQSAQVTDAAAKFIASTPSHLALLPLEDALALEEQPNVPGTIEQHPNWRRRYDGEAADLLDRPDARERLKPLAERHVL